MEQPKMTDAHVYVENDGFGHVYVEVDGTVYSYGRYDTSTTSSAADPVGNGVLLKFSGNDAKAFMDFHNEKFSPTKYTVKVNANNVKQYFDNKFNSGVWKNN
jgi:hypothetical protein